MQQKLNEWRNREALRVSARTLEQYERELRRFAGWGGGPQSTAGEVDCYLAGRKAGGLGASGLSIAVSAFKSFFRFVGSNSAAHLRAPRSPRRMQRALSDDEVVAALAALDSSSVIGKRDLALLGLMLASGLRASEAARLRIADVDLRRRVLTVVVKVGAERFGVFDEYAAQLVSSWLAVRPAGPEGVCAEMFVTLPAGRGGGRAEGGKQKAESSRAMTRQTVRLICYRAAKRAGVARFSPHALRRTFATLATANGCPSRVLMLAGRWSSIEMVERYTQSLDARKFDPYSPLQGLLGGELHP